MDQDPKQKKTNLIKRIQICIVIFNYNLELDPLRVCVKPRYGTVKDLNQRPYLDLLNSYSKYP